MKEMFDYIEFVKFLDLNCTNSQFWGQSARFGLLGHPWLVFGEKME